jgi:Tfp pilus assembly protein PilF
LREFSPSFASARKLQSIAHGNRIKQGGSIVKTNCAIVVAWIACCGSISAHNTDKEQLRKLAALPQIGFKCDLTTHVLTNKKAKPTQQEIDNVLKQMRGDVSDAERYSQLANLYNDRDEWPKAKDAFGTVVRLYRERLKVQAKDGRLHARLGEALAQVGENEQAETEMRIAVRIAPRDAECWSILAFELVDKSLFLVLNEGRTPRPKSSMDEKAKQMMTRPPSRQQLAEAEQLLEESRACIDKAVALDPKNAKMYSRRICWRLEAGSFRAFRRILAGEKKDFAMMARQAITSPEFIYDEYQSYKWRELVEPRKIAERAMLEFRFGHEIAQQRVKLASTRENQITFDDLPEASQQAIRADLGKLQQQIDAKDARLSSSAAEAHGMLLFLLLKDGKGAEKSLRRAISRDPSLENPRTVLEFILCEQNRGEDAKKVREEAIARKDSASNRYLLAKDYDFLGQSRQAAEQMEIGLRLDPGDFYCHLGLAALLMKRADAEGLKQAAEHFNKAKAALEKESTKNQRTEYQFLVALYAALTDHPSEAKEWLQELASSDKSAQVKKALAALGD